MTLQEKKNYLSGYREALKAAGRREAQLRRRESQGRGGDPLQEQLRRELGACLAERDRLAREIGAAADRLADPVLGRLIRERYLECRTWEEVAGGLHYDSRWVYRLHRRALEELTVGG